MLLHTDAFTHRCFYTETLLRKDAFTHKCFYTQTLMPYTHSPFTHRHFYTHQKSQFYLCFCRSNLISCEKVVSATLNRNSTSQFLPIEPHFVRKGPVGHVESQFFLSFCRSNLIPCERVVVPDKSRSQFYYSLADRTSFRAERSCRPR